MESPENNTFELLDPVSIIHAIESSFGMLLQNSLKTYTSYVNRVYGIRDEDGTEFVAKFYRPGRWSEPQLREEQYFVAQCAACDIPVVCPLPNRSGDTLSTLVIPDLSKPGVQGLFFYALFPCKAGRTFDTAGDDDWLRLGRLVGRMHTVARSASAPGRVICTPQKSTTDHLQYLWDQEVVNTDCRDEFFDLAEDMLDRIAPAFSGLPLQRIHGDCHRGNVLDRGPEGLLLVDFDDLMTGPAVQDLWLMLPGRRHDSVRELNLLLEGYGEYSPFDMATLDLVEALRYMRMVHYLAWCARQRHDSSFNHSFPSWGSRSFWVRETEDFRDQNRALLESGF